MELLSDERRAGRQHNGFRLSANADGDRVLGGDANGSVSFELAQICVGPGTVSISIDIYIDATYIKHWIPICPIYSELYDIIYDAIYILDDIINDIICSVCHGVCMLLTPFFASGLPEQRQERHVSSICFACALHMLGVSRILQHQDRL